MLIKDFKLHVEDIGNPRGETVVFLNGVMASTNSWYQIMKYFIRNDYRVILHDFKGQLKSDKPEGPYTFSEHAEETIMILKNLGIKHAHFIGTSYGGEVALNIGFRYPEYVTSITVIDSVSEVDEPMKKEINNWIGLCQKKDGYKFFWGMAKSIYGPKFMNENIEFLEMRAKATAKVDSMYFEGQIRLYQTFNNDVYMTNRLKEIKAPTLVICGEDDMLKPVRFSKLIHHEIKGSEFVLLPECGHVAIFEKPDELVSLLVGFVTKHKA